MHNAKQQLLRGIPTQDWNVLYNIKQTIFNTWSYLERCGTVNVTGCLQRCFVSGYERQPTRFEVQPRPPQHNPNQLALHCTDMQPYRSNHFKACSGRKPTWPHPTSDIYWMPIFLFISFRPNLSVIRPAYLPESPTVGSTATSNSGIQGMGVCVCVVSFYNQGGTCRTDLGHLQKPSPATQPNSKNQDRRCSIRNIPTWDRFTLR